MTASALLLRRSNVRLAMGGKKRGNARYERVSTGVYERNGKFYAKLYANGKQGWSRPYRTQAEAEKARIDHRHRKDARKRGEETVGAFFERWGEEFTDNRGEATIRHNIERAKKFAEDHGDRLLSDFSKDEAQRWASKGNKARVPAVRTMFSDAQKVGLVDDNPFVGLGIKKSRGRRDIVVLTEDELRQLVKAAGEMWGDYGERYFGPLIHIAAYTALRPGELFALRPCDIHYDEDYIEVRRQWHSKLGRYEPTKSRRSRKVPLLPEAAAALKHVPRQAKESEPIFRTQRDQPLMQRTHFYYWQPVRATFWGRLPADRKEDIPQGFDFYELRHFFGSLLASWGMSPVDIGKAMGHADNGQTAMEVYIHTDEDDARKRILDQARKRQMEGGPVADPVTPRSEPAS